MSRLCVYDLVVSTMVESDDDAAASSWIVAGPTNEEPAAGSVIDTTGDWFCPNAVAEPIRKPIRSRAAGRDTPQSQRRQFASRAPCRSLMDQFLRKFM
jgi:hypothetical protein